MGNPYDNKGYRKDEDGSSSEEDEDIEAAPPRAPPPSTELPPAYAQVGDVNYIPEQNDEDSEVKNDEDSEVKNEERPQIEDVPYLSEAEAKQALVEYVDRHCCYTQTPTEAMKFSNLESAYVDRYIIETYTESRTTENVYESYRGGPIYIDSSRPAPGPWEIKVLPEKMFNSHEKLVEVPNTSRVENCGKCRGRGTKRCFTCSGRGMTQCNSCHGSGQYQGNRCHNCTGGYIRCYSCMGEGRKTCLYCNGYGQLRWYVQLKVNFENNVSDYIKETKITTFPEEYLRTCTAQNVFEEKNVRVLPITNHPDAEMNEASSQLIAQHSQQFANKRILQQKHELNVIPLTLCTYEFKEEEYKYHIYGLDRQVYAPDYPRKFCCSIS